MNLSSLPGARVCLLIAVLLQCVNTAAASPSGQTTYTVAVNTPGAFPYLYFDEKNQRYVGAFKDFFDDIEKRGELVFDYVDSNQLRSEQFVTSGKIDFYIVNPAWLPQQHGLISSHALTLHHTYLYSLSPFPADFSLHTAQGKRVCTRQQFVYTGLTEYFTNRTLERIDTSSAQSMTSMLLKQRCDYVVFGQYVALDEFATANLCHLHVYQSPQPTSSVTLNIVMRPQLQQIKQQIDRLLQDFIAHGKMDTALKAHSSTRLFPRKPSC